MRSPEHEAAVRRADAARPLSELPKNPTTVQLLHRLREHLESAGNMVGAVMLTHPEDAQLISDLHDVIGSIGAALGIHDALRNSRQTEEAGNAQS
jgi:hypothetical protein